jgi:hypothetical protein
MRLAAPGLRLLARGNVRVLLQLHADSTGAVAFENAAPPSAATNSGAVPEVLREQFCAKAVLTLLFWQTISFISQFMEWNIQLPPIR